MPTNQVVALLSCLVYNDKVKDDASPKLAPELEGPFRQLEESARKIAKVSQVCNSDNLQNCNFIVSGCVGCFEHSDLFWL